MTLTLFGYQQKVVEDVKDENAIIKMPTGSGKTFVAAELIRRRLANIATKRAIFFVPTVDLVDQQAQAIEKWYGTGEEVARYHGGLSTPIISMHRVLVSTASAFLGLQARLTQLDWDSCCICVFDEVHHVLKDHPYRKISHKLRRFVHQNEKAIQILGLSASLTYGVDDHSIKKTLDNLCVDLCIKKMCSPTTADLIAGGYRPQQDHCEIVDCRETPEGVLPEWKREPHLMHDIFTNRVEKRQATSFALLMWDTIKLMEDHAISLHVNFCSPLQHQQLSSWAEYASKFKRKYDDHAEFFQKLEDWYVGLKLLVVTWEEEEPLTMQWLILSDALKVLTDYTSPLVQQVGMVEQLASNKANYMKLNVLCDQLLEKKRRFNNSFRCIIFVQQRISAYIVANFINSTVILSEKGLEANFVAAKGSKLSPSMKVTPTQNKTSLENFRDGSTDILVATSVAEEVSTAKLSAITGQTFFLPNEYSRMRIVILIQGIDVPAANVVISYNHMKDSVELCQRTGRARQKDCAIVIMAQRRDRPVSMLRKVQQYQEEIIKKFDPSTIIVRSAKTDVQAQLQREAQASSLLNNFGADSISILHQYRQKTKAHLDDNELYTQNNTYAIKLTYSTQYVSIDAEGNGISKKAAKQEAAKLLLQKLKRKNSGVGM
jgi:ERCC4-related helicase